MVPELRNSHIIAETFYEPIYDKQHRFIPIQERVAGAARIQQKGYREHLLCAECEQMLGRWENITKRTLAEISATEPSRLVTRSDIGHGFTLIEGINYNAFKKCMLSILWRMSVTTVDIFREYVLGTLHEEKIRKALLRDSAPTVLEYPLSMHRVTLEGRHYPDLVTGMKKGRIDGRFIQQSFIIYGFLIDVVVSPGFPKNRGCVFLDETGRVPIRDLEFDELPKNRPLLDRFNDSDVLRLYPRRD